MDDYDPSEEFTISDVTEAESIITDNYNAVHPAGDLPSRALIEAGVFEDTGARLLMRDLQTLDGERVLLADAAMPKDAAAALAGLTFAEPEPWLKDLILGTTGRAHPAPSTR